MAHTTPSVLVVEDDAALNEAYCIILRSAGYEVSTAFNGQEALDLLGRMSTLPQVILLDLRMPVMDGIEFLRAFQPATHPESTVIVFSNYDAHKDIHEAYELGVERYVLKARAAPKDLLHLVEGVVKDPSVVLG